MLPERNVTASASAHDRALELGEGTLTRVHQSSLFKSIQPLVGPLAEPAVKRILDSPTFQVCRQSCFTPLATLHSDCQDSLQLVTGCPSFLSNLGVIHLTRFLPTLYAGCQGAPHADDTQSCVSALASCDGSTLFCTCVFSVSQHSVDAFWTWSAPGNRLKNPALFCQKPNNINGESYAGTKPFLSRDSCFASRKTSQ